MGVTEVGKPGGYQKKRKVYVLDFEGTDLEGLTVRARSSSIDEFLTFGRLADAVDGTTDRTAGEGALNAMLEHFERVLVSWDLLDDDGALVPTTAAGLRTLDMGDIKLLIQAWQSAVAAVPTPLPAASTDGSPSVALSMPMEPLSPSLAS